MKKILSICLVIMLVFSTVLTGCGEKEKTDYLDDIKLVETNDSYRNFYQIWIGSFCDSNNDETGDIPGIISKLDYLNDGDPDTDTDLGIDGIWLSPFMPSPSYHKYDVTDYYNVDEEFGTLEDFDKLVEECDKRGINIIIDLVINHCSSKHPWFQKACEEAKEGNFDGYARYFEIEQSDTSPGDGYRQVAGTSDLWYEGNFTFEMPEWNLDSDLAREEIMKISKFWLDRGVAGFRLDAVKYFSNAHTDSTEFLNWYYDECKKIKPDVYMVGENWVGTDEIYEVYESGIDSQFAFRFGNNDGLFINAVRTGASGEKVITQAANYDNKIRNINSNVKNAWFLTNHDMVRSANALKPLSNKKMAAALYLMLPGCTFTYYGEEIGIMAPNTNNDASYRTPMIWDDQNLPDIYVPGVAEDSVPEYGGVKQQEEDGKSLLNFYKRAFKIKNQNPEIARGKITDTVDFGDESVGAYYVEYEGSRLLIIHNMSLDDGKVLTISDDIMKNAKIRGDLVSSDGTNEEETTISGRGNTENSEEEKLDIKEITLNKGELKMPPQSTVILKAKDK